MKLASNWTCYDLLHICWSRACFFSQLETVEDARLRSERDEALEVVVWTWQNRICCAGALCNRCRRHSLLCCTTLWDNACTPTRNWRMPPLFFTNNSSLLFLFLCVLRRTYRKKRMSISTWCGMFGCRSFDPLCLHGTRTTANLSWNLSSNGCLFCPRGWWRIY